MNSCGEAADWELIAGSLFRAGFGVMVKLPEDGARHLPGASMRS
jgi:hypothetical protein